MRKILVPPLLFVLLLIGCGERTEQMRALLHEQDSLNRAFVPFTTDSTVRLLADYFDHHGTNYDRVWAHYLLGSALRDMREAPAALAAFQHAAELADTTAGGDSIFSLLAKIHGQMGEIFDRQYLPQQSKQAYEEASRNAMTAGDTLLALLFQRFIVSAYYQQHQFDSIDRFSEHIAYELRRRGDTINAARMLGVAISSNIERDSLEKARNYMDIYEREGDIYDEDGNLRPYLSVYNYYRGLYMLKTNELSKAEQSFRDVLIHTDDMESIKGGYDGLRRLYSKLGQRDSALKYTMLYADANDTCYFHQSREETVNMQSLYHFERVQRIAHQKTMQLERTKSNAVVICACLFSIIIGLVTAFYTYRKRKMKEFIKRQHSYVIAQEEIEKLEREIEEEKERLAQSGVEITGQQRKISDLTEEIAQMKYHLSCLRPEGKLLDTIKNLVRARISMSAMDWKDVMAYQEENDPLFLSRLGEACSSLTSLETKLCILTRMGISVGDIAILMDKSVAMISKTRNHLMKKIFNSSRGAKGFDDRIRQL